MKTRNVTCFYDGKSQIDNKRVLGFLYHGETENPKIGNKFNYTVYAPIERTTSKSLQTTSVCGNCPLKPENSNTCYVGAYFLATINKWIKWYEQGQIQKINLTSHTKRYLRLGMSGDPLSVPIDVTRKLMSFYDRTISYTHQYFLAPQAKDFTLVSTQSRKQAEFLHKHGYRTARISEGDDLLPNEVVCANQRNPKITCSTCNLCDKSTKNIVFLPHSRRSKVLKEMIE